MLAIGISLTSCSSIRLDKQESKKQITTFGLEVTYDEDIDLRLKNRIDSVVSITTARFNAEERNFDLVTATAQSGETVKLHFSKASLISKRHRTTAYIANGVTPLVGLAAGATAPILLNYFPKHKIRSTMTLSDKISEQCHEKDKIKSNAGVFFSDLNEKEDKLLTKYAGRFYNQLIEIDTQLKAMPM